MIRLNDKKAQNMIEYAIVVSLVTSAMVAMSTYVFRSVQSTQKTLESDYGVQTLTE